jgi:hypothetical protein
VTAEVRHASFAARCRGRWRGRCASGWPSGCAATPIANRSPPTSRASSTSSTACSSSWNAVRVVAGRVAAQRQDVLHPGVAVAGEDRAELVAGVGHRGQVRHRGHRGALEQVDHDPVGALAGRATGAVGDRHERGRERLELVQRVAQVALALVGLRGKNSNEVVGPAASRSSMRVTGAPRPYRGTSSPSGNAVAGCTTSRTGRRARPPATRTALRTASGEAPRPAPQGRGAHGPTGETNRPELPGPGAPPGPPRGRPALRRGELHAHVDGDHALAVGRTNTGLRSSSATSGRSSTIALMRYSRSLSAPTSAGGTRGSRSAAAPSAGRRACRRRRRRSAG